MDLLADECVVDHLREEGYKVLYVAEMAPSISDSMILKKANKKNALLLTADKDFGELVFRQNHITAGVLLFRLAGLSQMEKTKIVSSVIRKHSSELFQSFTVVSRGMVRIRKRV